MLCRYFHKGELILHQQLRTTQNGSQCKHRGLTGEKNEHTNDREQGSKDASLQNELCVSVVALIVGALQK